MDERIERRAFLKTLATAAGAVVLVPAVSRCASTVAGVSTAGDAAVDAVPVVPPPGWDPIDFNRVRGNAGAIPQTYLPAINGPDGDKKHLGKHLPYRPTVAADAVPAGYVALMWGDPEKGHARHPNAARDDAAGQLGHWYSWIKVRPAVAGEAEEATSAYSSWPAAGAGDTGAYAVFGDGDITADGGRNTIYLAALPAGVKPGDTVRIWAHCLTHGEYVDFLTL
ncbi:MAG: hypothetical protein EP329_13815 [Deltaproteobacteria bacterium]|nr:MAG: hypothetical protein EP329_13815 [Deltaproteobacteria bacterium]